MIYNVYICKFETICNKNLIKVLQFLKHFCYKFKKLFQKFSICFEIFFKYFIIEILYIFNKVFQIFSVLYKMHKIILTIPLAFAF